VAADAELIDHRAGADAFLRLRADGLLRRRAERQKEESRRCGDSHGAEYNPRPMRRLSLVAVVGLLFAVAVVAQDRRPAGTTFSGKAFRFNKVKEGIYHALGTGAMQVVGNSTILVNERDAIVIDDHVSPAAAWVLLEELKAITDKPVTTVINTHFHYDHAHGNQIFGPDVQIIGHEFTRQMLAGKPLEHPLYRNYINGMPGQIENLKKRIAGETDPAAKAKLETQLVSAENNYASQKELRPTPPNVTLTTQMTLHRGDREIQIRYLGRGHTAGDVVVYLPRERVVITGDFLTSSTSNMSDSYPLEWAASLDELKKLDFDTIVPGHGEAYTDRAKIDYFQAYLRDVWTTIGELKKQGVPAAEAAKRADLSKHKERFPNPTVPAIAAERIYALLDGTAR
jgi:glyoxylase-like metal-dependent hydrolase (beta-lactamase superfamily II)